MTHPPKTSPQNSPKPLAPLMVDAALLDVRSVASLCGCSTRHVRRLADAGRMPAPLKLGALLRWRRADVVGWIDAGCPTVRTQGGPRR